MNKRLTTFFALAFLVAPIGPLLGTRRAESAHEVHRGVDRYRS
jgi:hypothetical protein